MDLRQLAFFVKVVESGSISKAAQALNIAQPSLSQRVKDLEAELGAELLHRTAFGVTPTEIGLMLADRARSVLRQIEHLKLEVASAGGKPQGQVAVGLPTTMALHLTVPLVQSVMTRFPEINLRVTEGMSGHIQEWVLSGRIDIALLYSADPVPTLDLQHLLSEDLYLVAARKRHQHEPASIRLAEVAELPLVLPGRGHGLRRNIERVAEGARIALKVPVEVDSLTYMKSLVTEGELFTILPWAACREEIRAGTVVARRIVAPVLRRPVVLAMPRDRPLSVAVRSVAKLMESLVAHAVGSARKLAVRR